MAVQPAMNQALPWTAAVAAGKTVLVVTAFFVLFKVSFLPLRQLERCIAAAADVLAYAGGVWLCGLDTGL